jgi:hypothetical protein
MKVLIHRKMVLFANTWLIETNLVEHSSSEAYSHSAGQEIPHLLENTEVWMNQGPWPCATLPNLLVFYDGGLLVSYPIRRLEDHPLLAVCDCLFRHLQIPSLPKGNINKLQHISALFASALHLNSWECLVHSPAELSESLVGWAVSVGEDDPQQTQTHRSQNLQ